MSKRFGRLETWTQLYTVTRQHWKIGGLGHVASGSSAYILLWDAELAAHLDIAQRSGAESADRGDWDIEGHTGQWSTFVPQMFSIYAAQRIIVPRLPFVP